jgi:hypothetical protein
VSTPRSPRITPELREWLQRERAWGNQALHALARQRRLLAGDKHGLERFARRMALVDLAGSVTRWAHGLHDALIRVGLGEAAAVFAVAPHLPATEPTSADCEELTAYVQSGIAVLGELLASWER